jgi:NADPH2:quinone reductase
MRALELSATTGPSALNVADLPIPNAAEGQALIRVRACGVNYADLAQARGLYPGSPKPPFVPGFELSGEVVSTAPGFRIAVGSRVMGFGSGAFAEYVAWPISRLLPVPEGWSFTQAAAFPVAWLTAHGCLRLGRLRAGETVLIHAAAGGVGSAAVRLAKHLGARILATASSPEKLELARRQGADELIDYTKEDFAARVLEKTQGRGVDLVLEMVGGDTFRKNFEAVVPFGRIVVFGAASFEQASLSNVQLMFRPVEVIGYHLVVMAQKRPDLLRQELEAVHALIEQGVIEPDEPSSYPFAEGARALEDLGARKTTGKIVLVV